jgi:TatD DNase family protein
MLTDSHCHLDQLDLTAYEGDLDKAVKAAESQGVQHILSVCTTMRDFPKVLEIANRYSQVYASVGLHPNELDIDHEPTTEELIKLGTQPKVVAVGETGLDYYRSTGDIEWQRDRFRRHIQAALVLKKPLIVHTRQAKTDTIQLLREEQASQIGGVMHCFTEDWQTACEAMDLNFYISFSGIVTFRNAVEIQEVARKIPLDRMLIETDSPYLAPIPHRGKPNEPAYVKFVAEFIANLRGMDKEELAQRTTENYLKLFFKN